ncbi:MAG TPA: dienelactone hydrolase family protein [Burkholderiales bacterium]|nr:dienelactone hydrolase family protein [Burkholderiales bacterium]
MHGARRDCGSAQFALGALLALCATAAMAGSSDVMVGVKHNLRAELITPDGPGPYPGVLVLHTSGGLQAADTAFAQRLAKEGYVALVPSFLAAYDITARTRRETFTTDAQPIYADFVASLDTLRHEPKVAGSKLGAIGFSNGGYFALWLAATGKVDAGVSYYGALSGAGTDRALERFRDAFGKGSAPVLILHGTRDLTVPVGLARHLANILSAKHSVYELQLYPGAGHAFDRENDAADTSAAADSWPRTLGFLAKYLKRP